MKKQSNPLPVPLKRRLLTIQETSEYTGVSINALYKWVNQRKIPFVKIGRLVKFDLTQLDDWIKQQTVMPMHERWR